MSVKDTVLCTEVESSDIDIKFCRGYSCDIVDHTDTVSTLEADTGKLATAGFEWFVPFNRYNVFS